MHHIEIELRIPDLYCQGWVNPYSQTWYDDELKMKVRKIKRKVHQKAKKHDH